MEHGNELANAGLWNTLDELTEYPRTNATQHAINIVGDAIDAIGIQPVERCAYCGNVATEMCDVCGASLCNNHVVHMPYPHWHKHIVPCVTCA